MRTCEYCGREHSRAQACESCGFEPGVNQSLGPRGVEPQGNPPSGGPVWQGAKSDSVLVNRTIAIDLAANNRVAQIQYVASTLLKSMKHGVQPTAAYCSLHQTLLFAQTDARGTIWRDYSANFHGPGFDQRCTILPIPNSVLISVMGQEQPKISEFMETIVRVKQDLDRQASERQINENKRRSTRYVRE